MTKLKGLLTEGMHGMISQVEGLAKALDLDFIHEKLNLIIFEAYSSKNLLQYIILYLKIKLIMILMLLFLVAEKALFHHFF